MAYFHTTVLDNQIKALPTVDTASGSIATFDTDLTENLVSVKCQIVAQQASGTPTPDNPLPITTYAEMNVWRGNNNLLPNTATTQTINDVTFTVNADKSITVNGLASADTNFIVNHTTEIKKSGNYILKGCPLGGSGTTYYLRSTRGITALDVGNGSLSVPYSQGQNLYVYIFIKSGVNADNLVFKPMIIHENETDTEYHAYNGTTANIPFGQTVANGVLDITTGKLRVTHKIWQTDGTEIWNDGGNGDYYTTSHYSFDSMTGSSNGLSNYFVYNWSLSQTNGCMAYTNRIQLTKTSYESVADLVADFTNTPLVIVYPLATPIDIQLDSTQLTALLNENNIWCDTGDTEVKYLLTVGKKIS